MNHSSHLPRRTVHISHQEFLELLGRWREHGDTAARDRILISYIPYARKIARKIAKPTWVREDAIAEAMLALPIALDKFDEKHGVVFATYAQHWIRALVVKLVYSAGGAGTTGFGRGERKAYYNALRTTRIIEQETGEPASVHEIARRLNVSPVAVEHILGRVNARNDSIAQFASRKHAGLAPARIEESLAAEGESPEESVAASQERTLAFALVDAFVETLDERERDVFNSRIRTPDDEQPPLQEVADRWSISRERIRQIEKRLRSKFADFVAERGIDASEELHRVA